MIGPRHCRVSREIPQATCAPETVLLSKQEFLRMQLTKETREGASKRSESSFAEQRCPRHQLPCSPDGEQFFSRQPRQNPLRSGDTSGSVRLSRACARAVPSPEVAEKRLPPSLWLFTRAGWSSELQQEFEERTPMGAACQCRGNTLCAYAAALEHDKAISCECVPRIPATQS